MVKLFITSTSEKIWGGIVMLLYWYWCCCVDSISLEDWGSIQRKKSRTMWRYSLDGMWQDSTKFVFFQHPKHTSAARLEFPCILEITYLFALILYSTICFIYFYTTNASTRLIGPRFCPKRPRTTPRLSSLSHPFLFPLSTAAPAFPSVPPSKLKCGVPFLPIHPPQRSHSVSQ